MIDLGQAMVTDVFQAAFAQCEHKPVGGFDRHLRIFNTIDQKKRWNVRRDLFVRRSRFVSGNPLAFRWAAHESSAHLAQDTASMLLNEIDRPAITRDRLYRA